jgi:hypothetical protein
VASGFDMVASIANFFTQQVAHRGVVFDDQNPSSMTRAHATLYQIRSGGSNQRTAPSLGSP